MSFKIKDKTIFITVRSIIVLIMTVTLCVLALWDRDTKYDKLFESVLLIAVGYIFGRGETDKNE